MGFDPKQHHRRSIRLKDYDYLQAGAYFVTICIQSRQCLLGEIAGAEMRLNPAGVMVGRAWQALPSRFPFVALDQFVAMPNHVHGIIVLTDITRRGESRIRPTPPQAGDHKDRPYGTSAGTIGRIVQAFKSITTHECTMAVRREGWAPFRGRLWQRNYYERVIRHDGELNAIRGYVPDNPAHWAFDRENPACVAADTGAPPSASKDDIETIFGEKRP